MNPLAHDCTDHEAYGKAMVECQGYTPACSDAGECLLDGICFSASGRGFKRARAQVQALVDAEMDVYARSWLKHALDALDHDRFMQRGALDAMRYLTINKRVRALYNWKP